MHTTRRILLTLVATLALSLPLAAQEMDWDRALSGIERCANLRAGCKALDALATHVEKDREKLATLAAGTPKAQAAALAIMARVGGHAGALTKLMEATDVEVRLEAIGLAANTGQKELAPTILELAKVARETGDERTLLKALFAFGRLGYAEATPLLLELVRDPVQKVSRAALEALGRVGGDDGVVDLIVKQTADTSQPIQRRLTAIEGLGYFKNPKATDALIELSRDDDLQVRLAAIEALGQTGDRRAVPPLADRLKEPEVIPVLVVALGRIGGEKAASMLFVIADSEGTDEALRFQALCAAAKAGSKKARPALVKVLSDGQPKEREAAIEALGHLADPKAVRPLFERMKKGSGREKTLAHWAIKRCTGKALETEEQIEEYLKEKAEKK
jgi:HEAT repeat protein